MLSKEQLNYLLKTKARYRWMLDSGEIGTVTIQDVFETIETQQKALEKAKETLTQIIHCIHGSHLSSTDAEKWYKVLQEIEKLGVEE
uniref:Uncharacterized protein n=1 Tax=viral metagenome TaxID=1070528 RepID=A0A6M3XKA2_9ZZZZ